MFPVQDTVPARGLPLATIAIIIINALVFWHQVSLPQHALESFIARYALVPARYFGPTAAVHTPDFGSYYPFFTNMFLHAGWAHIIFNMWTLWVFGRAVEDRLGTARFVGFYLICGVAASIAHAVVNANSQIPALGASGAIAGVIGCYARLFPFARLIMMVPIVFIPFFFEIPAMAFAVLWAVMQLVPGLFSLVQGPETGGVAWWAHIGGFVAGWLLVPFIRRGRAYRRYYADEGIFGFRPDGRRKGGAGPWV